MSDLKDAARRSAAILRNEVIEPAVADPGPAPMEQPESESASAAAGVELDASIQASDETVPVHVAYSRVMGEVQYVAKSDRRQDPGGRYMFRGIDALLQAVGPALRKHQLAFVPSRTVTSYDTVPVGNNKVMQRCRVVVDYSAVGPRGDIFPVPIQAAGEAFDSGDKATSKALSVALRTAYIQAFAIPVHQPEMDTERGPQYEVTAPPPPSVQEYQTEIDNPMTSTDRLRQIYSELGQHHMLTERVETVDGPSTLGEHLKAVGAARSGQSR